MRRLINNVPDGWKYHSETTVDGNLVEDKPANVYTNSDRSFEVVIIAPWCHGQSFVTLYRTIAHPDTDGTRTEIVRKAIFYNEDAVKMGRWAMRTADSQYEHWQEDRELDDLESKLATM